jgi:hypothetical protein
VTVAPADPPDPAAPAALVASDEDAGARVAAPAPSDPATEALVDAGPGPATAWYDDMERGRGTLRLRVPRVAHQAARSTSPVLFELAAGHQVALLGRRGPWVLIEWEGGRGPSLQVPFGARGWIALDVDDGTKVERLALTDAGVPIIP